MKTCDYCAKEITYDKQYCNDKCERGALKYYKKVKTKQTLFSIINIVSMIAIMVGAFWAFLASVQVGTLIAAAGFLIMGMLYIILPFGNEGQIKKYKIEKMQKNNKILGSILLLISLIALVLAFVLH